MHFHGNYTISLIFLKFLSGHFPPLKMNIFNQFHDPHGTQGGILFAFQVVNETTLNPILLRVSDHHFLHHLCSFQTSSGIKICKIL